MGKGGKGEVLGGSRWCPVPSAFAFPHSTLHDAKLGKTFVAAMGEILRFMFFIKHICGEACFSSEGTNAKIHCAATKVCPIRKT